MDKLTITLLAIFTAGTSTSCSVMRESDAISARVEPEATVELGKDAGSVLRIVCDIPDRVGSVAKTYRGRIDWSGGSESFSFKLSGESFDVPLKNTLNSHDIVRVFFIVDQEPPFPTKFTRGEWFYRGRLARAEAEDQTNSFCVRLSRFRDADRFAATLAP